MYIKRSFAFLVEEAAEGSDLDVVFTPESDTDTLDEPSVDFVPADGFEATFESAAA